MTTNLPTLAQSSSQTPARLVSLDAFRGFVMLAMASAGLGLPEVAKSFSGCWFWDGAVNQFSHVLWTGCGFWDLIQPAFMFMVGVAMPYSFASRQGKGETYAQMAAHSIWRSLLLIALGIFLSSNWSRQTNYTFVNVLTQIGLGYSFVFLLIGRGRAVQLTALAAILIGYWFVFVSYPIPDAQFNYEAVKTSEGERLAGWAGHWNKNANFASDFDRRFLNLFPREEEFRFNEGGYQTLNFIPSMATMVFGLMAGEMLRSNRPPRGKRNRLLWAGALCLLSGVVIDHTIWPDWLAQASSWVAQQTGSSSAFFSREWTLCPIVKRIWTPSWVIFSAGWSFWMLMAFYAIIDIRGYRRWAFPFVVVGMNSIAMYCMAQLLKPWIRQTFKIHFGSSAFEGTYGPLVQSASVLLFLWLVCLWMFRQKIFIRI